MKARRKLRVEGQKEILKHNKENSYDVLDAWGINDQIEFENEIHEENGEFYDMNGFDKTMSLSEFLRDYCCYTTSIPIEHGLTKGQLALIQKKREAEMWELWELMQSKKYFINWAENGKFVTISRTFQIDHDTFDKFYYDNELDKEINRR